MLFIDNLTKEIGDRKLFSIDKIAVSEDERIGLIGDNGSGKTTLIRILAGLDNDYSGRVEVTSEIRYLTNEQDFDRKDEHDLREHRKDEHEPDDYRKEMHSPGEHQRIKLEELLSDRDAFLLLDEPTSHLDIGQKDRLAESLNNRYTGFILISHDRDFIDKTCDKIWELHDGELEIYNGNYSFYLEERVKRRKCAEREYESYISEKKRLTGIVNDIKASSAKIKTTPDRMGNSEARLHKMGGQGNKKKLDKQAKAARTRLEQLEVKEKPKDEMPIELTVSDKEKIFSKVLVRSEKLNKRFGDKVIFDDASLEIPGGCKIALLGDNGSGKTTLLNMILNREVWVHPNLKIGYYSQLGEILDTSKPILDNVLESSIYDQTMTRVILARLGFQMDDVFKPVSVLSDGERAKVKLAKLVTSDFNYLMMDEPTNYLDIRAIEALEELLKGYDRPLLFVTHDVSFINNIADRLLLIENKKIKSVTGNLEQYRKQKKQKPRSSGAGSDSLLTDFRIASISTRLSMEIPKEEREKLEEEYRRLLEAKNNS